MERDKKKIVWLASYPKSGNTWFRAFLSYLLFKSDKPFDLNHLQNIPVASSRTLFDKYTGANSSDLLPSEIENLRPEIYKKIAEEADDPVFLKVHDSWHLTPSGIPLFHSDYTKGVIYIIRNPLDIAVSFSSHLGIDIASTIKKMNNIKSELCFNEEKLYHQFKQHLSDWSGHVRSWTELSGLPVKILRYESMLDDTYTSFKSALEFLDINKDTKEIKMAIEQCGFDRLSYLERTKGFQEKPISMNAFFRSGKSGIWRDHLKNEHVKSIISSHAAFMERYGYLE